MIEKFFKLLENLFKEDENKHNVILALLLNSAYNGIQG